MEDGDDMAYATPGHAEDHDFMTAFFSNQDHNAVRMMLRMIALLSDISKMNASDAFSKY